MKDEEIKTLLDEYTLGVNYPKISLDKAKNLIEERTKKAKKTKKLIVSFASLACALVIVLSTVLLINSTTVKYYKMDSLSIKQTTYKALCLDNDYRSYVKPFDKLQNKTSSHIDYYIYYEGDNAVILKLEITNITNNGAESAVFYLEFTDSRYTCDGFKDYYELETKGELFNKEFTYSGERVAGEWVYSAYCKGKFARYFVDINSPDKDALNRYMNLIKK